MGPAPFYDPYSTNQTTSPIWTTHEFILHLTLLILHHMIEISYAHSISYMRPAPFYVPYSTHQTGLQSVRVGFDL